jgi:uncharacterized protein YukE
MAYRAVKPPWPEGEPSWVDVVNRVIVRGRPQYLRNAADIYDDVFKALHEVANDIDAQLAVLGRSWSGPAYDSYHRSVAGIATELRRIIDEANEFGGISTALRQAGDRLYAYQQVIPIPNDCAADVVRAHQEGLQLTQGQLEDALRKEAEDSGFFSFFFDFLEWLGDVIDDNTGTARDRYRELSSEYANMAASAPDSIEPPRVTNPGGYTPPPGSGGGIGPGGTYRTPGGGDHTGPPYYPPGWDPSQPLPPGWDPSYPGGKPPYPGSGGPDVGGLAGAGSGGLTGLGGGVGQGAGGKFSDTGAAFGAPVNLMGALPPGAGGMGMGMPMGAGAGGAGAGDGQDGYTTWLTEDDDTWTRSGDGRAAPPVLE